MKNVPREWVSNLLDRHSARSRDQGCEARFRLVKGHRIRSLGEGTGFRRLPDCKGQTDPQEGPAYQSCSNQPKYCGRLGQVLPDVRQFQEEERCREEGWYCYPNQSVQTEGVVDAPSLQTKPQNLRLKHHTSNHGGGETEAEH